LAKTPKQQNTMKKNLLILSIAICGIANAQTIAGGYEHSLAVCNNNTVRAWGNNQYGQLGNGNNTDSNVPVQVTSLTGITAIAVGYNHSIALKNDGTPVGAKLYFVPK